MGNLAGLSWPLLTSRVVSMFHQHVLMDAAACSSLKRRLLHPLQGIFSKFHIVRIIHVCAHVPIGRLCRRHPQHGRLLVLSHQLPTHLPVHKLQRTLSRSSMTGVEDAETLGL